MRLMSQESLMMRTSSLAFDVFNRSAEDGTAVDLRDEVPETSTFEEIVGSFCAILRVTAQVMRVAPSDATVRAKIKTLHINKNRYRSLAACGE
jgi:hypothetical protein